MLNTKPKIVPKYRQIEQELLELITSDKVGIGEQIPTEHVLSNQYNVSRLTARKAIGNLENQGYLVRTPGRGTFVADWRESPDHKNNRNIAALFVDMDTDNLWNSRVLQAISRESEQRDYHVSFCGVAGHDLAGGRLPLAIRQETVKGAIINGSLTDLQLKHLREYPIPYMFVGNIENPLGLPAITFDAEDMTCKITSALLTLDRGPVWLVVEPFRLFYTRQMYRGYQRAIFEKPNPTNLLNACDPRECAATVERMVNSGQKEFCLLVMPSYVLGLIDHIQRSSIDMACVTMVVVGQREPWWRHDEQIILCEISPDMMAREAVEQLIGTLDHHRPLVGRDFKLEIETTKDPQKPFRFSWK